jgi:hypothetical protein
MKKLYSLLAAALCTASAFAQWSTDRDIATTIFPEDKNTYSHEVCVGADGTVWFFCDNPSSIEVEDIHTAAYVMRVQAFTPDGERKFGDDGLILSAYDNQSWTVCNQYMYANRDSTVTIVVHDRRNSNSTEGVMNYTAYRLRPDGTHVWDEDGVPVDNAMYSGANAAMSICEIEDGSNIFAWLWQTSSTAVSLQKITKEGEPQWDPNETKLAGAYNDYPYVVDAGNNQFILVWGRSSSEYLTAMKYNADGTQAWNKRVTIYDGGFGSVPLWTFLDVKPSGDGGVICAWHDDRTLSNVPSVYMAYVKNDGTLGFTNADGGADIRLSYSEWNQYYPDVYPDGQGTGFLAVYRQTSGGQSWGNIAIQHISMEGELLYGDEGIEIMRIDDEPKSVSYISIKPGSEGTFGVFYQTFYTYFDVLCEMSIRNLSDGQPRSEDEAVISIVDGGRYRSSLVSLVDPKHDRWYASWHDEGADSDHKRFAYCLQPIGFNGSMPGIESLNDVHKDFNTGRQLFDMQGHAVSPENALKGFFLVRENGQTRKVFIQ